jgi:2-phosphosulfolactate phosphatase
MYDRIIRVHDLPSAVDERELAGGVAIVVDVLRATSTICQALAAGASEVIPLREVEEARAAAEAAGRTNVVLGGERAGGRIAGFDLGNSPSEYTPNVVAGRRIVLTTTNGTQALYHARFARRVLIGSFLNVSAVVESVGDEERVDILCAGTDGEATREDILAAGVMVVGNAAPARHGGKLNDRAIEARREWEALTRRAVSELRPLGQQIALELRDTTGGQNLLGIGLDRDLVDCAQIDRFDIVPELNVAGWRITVPRSKKRPC